jgi:uncharacterized lipoprotein
MYFWKSKKFHLIASVTVVLGISACSGFEETQYNFNDKSYSESELEEHLADLLEVENSDFDVEIDVYQESDD